MNRDIAKALLDDVRARVKTSTKLHIADDKVVYVYPSVVRLQ